MTFVNACLICTELLPLFLPEVTTTSMAKFPKNFVTYVTEGLQKGDPNVIGIVVAVVVVFLTICK